MPTLASDLRSKLEKVVVEARDVAEAGARNALEALAIHQTQPYPHMDTNQRDLRNHLRARARQLGDYQDRTGQLSINHLTGECAYEHWHRMLFARFLAENHLLIEPEMGVPVSLEEAEELAKEDGVDVWVFASRCAQGMLPQIFRPDDPLLQVSFATEHRIKLQHLLSSLPAEVFTASDALGWVYQFWQSKKKEEVNRSEVKIGADEISAVTQLFTEPYMVEFLLHNTLGAWWAGKKLAENPTWAVEAQSEEDLRRRLALPGVTWDYLRFVRGVDGKGGPWRPAAGTFDGWPNAAKEIKILDPCCGSGHFLVAALHHMLPIRIAEEGLGPSDAVVAVLGDNLHGLEIDERCCQIAAFAMALAAWTFPGAGGYRALAELNIACAGLGPNCSKEQWLRLAEEAAAQGGLPAKRDLFSKDGSLLSAPVKGTLEALYKLFSKAPILGSLLNPRDLPADLFQANYQSVGHLLSAVLKVDSASDDIRERAITAAGMLKAIDLLDQRYTLVITNVPYRKRSDHHATLSVFANDYHTDARGDLATVMVSRSLNWLAPSGALAVVTPQNWLFLTTYKQLRERFLRNLTWCAVIWLGEHAFESQDAAGAFAAMEILVKAAPNGTEYFSGVDVSATRGEPPISASQKALLLREEIPNRHRMLSQVEQLNNPDCRVTFNTGAGLPLLNKFANSLQGTTSGDNPRFIATFWEVGQQTKLWSWFQTSCDEGIYFGGCHQILRWEDGQGDLALSPAARVQGQAAFGKRGVLVRQMGTLPVSHYVGGMFDMNGAVIVPDRGEYLAAIWTYLSSDDFRKEVRRIDAKLNVTNATLAKVPFDLARWQKLSSEEYSEGLPEPESDDPTQWLFHGRPEESKAPLHVAVARLMGYRWPAEFDDKMRLSDRARGLINRCAELSKFADIDGIVCIPSVRGTEPAAERFLALLSAAGINHGQLHELTGGADLDDWLRESFFEEHCKLFHDRPFVWHVWDGRKRDGFHALVNYHKLAEGDGKGRKLLESLTYSYLGDWITRQKDEVRRGEGGAEDRLAAALELQKRLEAILEGEPPFDLFVRWKPLRQQPIGWEPDINDGVRINIRPFLASDLPNGRKGAGVLRWKPNIKWGKDRGKEPSRPKSEYPWFWGWDEQTVDFMGAKEFDGNRWNDCHYTNGVKQAARQS